MARSRLQSQLLALSASAFLLCAEGASADTLVTKGGTRFDGQVKEDGEHYVVTTPNGGRMRIPKTIVKEIVRPHGGCIAGRRTHRNRRTGRLS